MKNHYVGITKEPPILYQLILKNLISDSELFKV